MLLLRVLGVLWLFCVVAPGTRAAAITIRAAGSSDLNTDTLIVPVDPKVDLEIVLDTQGLSFEGYYYGLDMTNGSVHGIDLTHRALAGLAADVFGAPAIDELGDTVRSVNQAKLSAGAGLAPGVYVLDTLSFTIDSNPLGELTVSGGLFGEVFGLGQGSCPGTVTGCNVEFFKATIVPEPSSAALLAVGLAAFAVTTRGRRFSR